ncbi:MAG: NAD(P)/FAD-dependent oxidoreductase [Myxococcaceae bacterium]|nr:NAD(P)/FAD-dependent oxidoreductase [Myxococcaceae bacterium]
MAQPHVVIVGGGFAGLNAAKALGSKPVRVTLVDRHNYHLFQPLLYQVATAGLSAGDIASPIRALLAKHKNIEVMLGEVSHVDVKAKQLTVDGRMLSYDALILATGVRHSYFGRPEWEHHAPGLKSLDDAFDIRRRVLGSFEVAELEEDDAVRQAWLTFVVVGAGPTGVELAGALAELARHTVANDFRRIDPRKSKVLLVEAGPRVLNGFDEQLAAKAQLALEKLGVEVRLNTKVTQVTATGVHLGDTSLPARTVLWAAGVEAEPLSRGMGVKVDRAGRIPVEPTLQIPGYADTYVVGDLAVFSTEDKGTLPGLAPVAMQQGKHAARNILAKIQGQSAQPFHYVNRGIMATVGRAYGIGQTGPFKLSGFIGWLGWLFIHLLFLVGFRNRVLVLVQWVWAYVTYQRGARLMTGALPSVLTAERPGVAGDGAFSPTRAKAFEQRR